ncbi:gamma-glutamylcyclotransferase [Bosea sp. (in: a-proteobacteria)]|uniref:gamma-glutamylcyclotransferase n=1 Tax=Bosea sp. (in: a-proteobacteria) TaxID=1871050 RepID=UPI00263313B2|nr:gamma-glutamylcyclotransferase [Bosea sp. (in: a-proteobacteria)]MCO5090786.1 gamma-glutamylcyclotransferase [Bosea sp. (in: a-proteobacteria)]
MTGECGTADLWVFGYGSLIWRPGFPFAESVQARLHGYHRSLCVFSHVHRGTPERPGLVLGLDRGGVCRGLAFRVRAAQAQATVAYLREREQATMVYRERHVALRLDDGRQVRGLVYVADRKHLQYAGKLPPARLLQIVREGRGQSGENPDYVLQTHEHLRQMGIFDPVLAGLAQELAPGLAAPHPPLAG